MGANTLGRMTNMLFEELERLNSIDAADVELKAKAEERVMELQDALAAYRTIVDMLKADVVGALREVA